MNGCENCLQYLVRYEKTENDYCPECGSKTLTWKQNSYGIFYMECTSCKSTVAVDLNTPCELDDELNQKVQVKIQPQSLTQEKAIIYQLMVQRD